MHLKPILTFGILLFFLLSCNRNSTELPPQKAPPTKLSISSKLNGLNIIDFVFEQNTTKDSVTVSLYIKNNTTDTLRRLYYVVELCKAIEKNYDNCDLQLVDSIREKIPPGQLSKQLYQWNNKGIKLKDSLINTGIIYCNTLPQHPLANAYSNIYAQFEGDFPKLSPVRGYILADGTATFRYKEQNSNAEGLFTSDKTTFSGDLLQGKEGVAEFGLDSITVSGTKKLIDEANGTLQFRLKLSPHLKDSTRTILTLLRKQY